MNRLHGRKQQRNEDADDGYDDQQLDKSKALLRMPENDMHLW